MTSDEFTAGSMNASSNERTRLAQASLKWNMDNKVEKFAERFDKHFVKMGLREGEKVKEEKKKEEPA
jgi:vacuolar-type H+-ATPase subunit B/Vma2